MSITRGRRAAAEAGELARTAALPAVVACHLARIQALNAAAASQDAARPLVERDEQRVPARAGGARVELRERLGRAALPSQGVHRRHRLQVVPRAGRGPQRESDQRPAPHHVTLCFSNFLRSSFSSDHSTSPDLRFVSFDVIL